MRGRRPNPAIRARWTRTLLRQGLFSKGTDQPPADMVRSNPPEGRACPGCLALAFRRRGDSPFCDRRSDLLTRPVSPIRGDASPDRIVPRERPPRWSPGERLLPPPSSCFRPNRLFWSPHRRSGVHLSRSAPDSSRSLYDICFFKVPRWESGLPRWDSAGQFGSRSCDRRRWRPSRGTKPPD